MDGKMAGKLQEIIDRHEIWQVLQRYCRGLDRIDRDLVRSCYFDDAIEDHGNFVGSVDDFIDWALKVSLSFVSCHHNVMNHSCDLDGDNAYCETYYLCMGVGAAPPHLLSMGRYIDHFQRRNGEWRIANRVALIEKNFDLADSLVGVGMPSSYGPEDAQPATHDRNDVSYHRPPRPRSPRRMQMR